MPKLISRRSFLYGGSIIEPGDTIEAVGDDALWLTAGPRPYAEAAEVEEGEAPKKTPARKKRKQ